MDDLKQKKSPVVNFKTVKYGDDCIKILEEELRIAKENPPREIFVMTVDEDFIINWSCSVMEDIPKTIGVLDVAKHLLMKRIFG